MAEERVSVLVRLPVAVLAGVDKRAKLNEISRNAAFTAACVAYVESGMGEVLSGDITPQPATEDIFG